ncbi:hypothetical protein FRB94_004066 [Tulasnella sp. JGI-2019a]|nr:hypothetical protein FRB94_004066 [Tulasnella sp. JGI-2019a]
MKPMPGREKAAKGKVCLNPTDDIPMPLILRLPKLANRISVAKNTPHRNRPSSGHAQSSGQRGSASMGGNTPKTQQGGKSHKRKGTAGQGAGAQRKRARGPN